MIGIWKAGDKVEDGPTRRKGVVLIGDCRMPLGGKHYDQCYVHWTLAERTSGKPKTWVRAERLLIDKD